MRTEKRQYKTIVIRPSVLRRGKRLAIKMGSKFHFLLEECLERQFNLIETRLRKRERALGLEKSEIESLTH